MKKLFITGLLLTVALPCFAKNVESVYVVKNQQSSSIVKELKSSLKESVCKDTTLYSTTPEFYYFRVYQSDNNVNVFVVSDKTTSEKYTSIVKSLPQKAYLLTDKDLSKKYNADLQKFVSLNDVKATGVKVEENPYNPYSKPLKNRVTKTTTYSNSGIDFKANKLAMKSSKLKRYEGFEVLVTNNTGANIVLKKASTGDFVGLTEVAKKVAVPNGVDFIPIYGIVAGVKTDVEKNMFTRPFPTDYVLKNGDTVRLLGIVNKQVSPIIDFTFEINGKDKAIQVNTY